MGSGRFRWFMLRQCLPQSSPEAIPDFPPARVIRGEDPQCLLGLQSTRRRTITSDRLQLLQHLLDPASGDPHQIIVDLGADEPPSFVDERHCRWHCSGTKNQIAIMSPGSVKVLTNNTASSIGCCHS